jgi:hypothetical protein
MLTTPSLPGVMPLMPWVMSLDTFNSLMETVHLLKTPANAVHLARSIEQYRQGKLTCELPPESN